MISPPGGNYNIRFLKIIFTDAKRLVILSIITYTLALLVTNAIPLVTKYAIDNFVTTGDSDIFTIIAIAYIVLAIVGGTLRYYSRWLAETVGQEVYRLVSNKLFQFYQNQSFEFYDSHSTGDLMSRASEDLRQLSFTVSFMFRGGLASVITFSSTVAIFFYLDYRLALIIFIFLIPQIIASYSFGKIMYPIFMARRSSYSDMNNVAQENITGIKVTQAFAMEEDRKKKYKEANNRYFQAGLNASMNRSLYMGLYRFMVGIETVFILFFGGYALVNNTGALSEGDLIASLLYVGLLVMPSRMLGFAVLLYSRSQAGLKRIFGILDVPQEEDKGTLNLNLSASPTISFENVFFKYQTSNKWILKDIKAEIPAGTSVAILGSTGSGKSTIINLIPRFYEPTKGIIKFDNIDISNVKLSSLRRNIGIVSQETFLFTDTIANNISFAKPGCSTDEIIRVSKLAKAHEFIEKFTDGYDSEVGERGLTLSGGQRQRISIARTLLLDPPIIIFDDSLSAVDIETELEIQSALKTLIETKRTTIIVTQRLSTLKMADLIYVMDNGELVEKGTHDELMKLNNIYKRLYETQIDGIIQDFPNSGIKEDN